MKTTKQIETEIKYFEAVLVEYKTRHSNLTQIDALSGEGSTIRKHIAKIEGKIEALKWVIF